jgi:DNA-binding Lrp family transcriptional regulator
MPRMDTIDRNIIRALQRDGRMSNAELATTVGLSPSACLRRVQQLEARKVIRGYTALVADSSTGEGSVVIVQITLDRQTEDFLDRFEAAVRKYPEIRECYLMTGDADYLLRVEMQEASDYETIHKDVLSRLPGVARIKSSFAIKRVVPGR